MQAQGFTQKFLETGDQERSGRRGAPPLLPRYTTTPVVYRDNTRREQEDLLMRKRLALRTMGEPDGSLFVFSFTTVLTLKEVGRDPLQLGEFSTSKNQA